MHLLNEAARTLLSQDPKWKAIPCPLLRGLTIPSLRGHRAARAETGTQSLVCEQTHPHELQRGGACGHHAQRDKPVGRTNTG